MRQEASNMKPPKPSGDEDRDKEALARYECRKRELQKWANQSENADRVSKTIISAETDARITCFRSDFDRDFHLLNCPNGVVDLRTGVLLPHDIGYMMSKLCPTEFDSTATSPIWDESLAAFTRRYPDPPSKVTRQRNASSSCTDPVMLEKAPSSTGSRMQ
jgi:phage/plasmid-associated DNA primase